MADTLKENTASSTKKIIDVNTTLKPKEGIFTFDAEGHDSGLWNSRVPHVPDDKSGLTIGRGYDMKLRNSAKVQADLINAGLSKEDAKKLSVGAGKMGNDARKVRDSDALKSFEIDSKTQVKLFEKTYKEAKDDVLRICNKPDTVDTYGNVDFSKLNPAIQDIVIDLRFRGDYDGETRKIVQKLIVNNDLNGLATAMKNRDNWQKVPKDRFDQRIEYMSRALEKENEAKFKAGKK